MIFLKSFKMFKIKKIALVVIGTLILSFSTAVFIVPHNLVVGGISGIAIIIENIIKSKYITVDVLISLLAWSAFVLGIIFLGKAFSIKTLISTLIYPFGVSLFSKLLNPEFLGGIFNLSASQYSEISVILASVFGGTLVGVGCSLAFLGGGSTGGIDIIAFIICKFVKRARSSKVIFIIDATTIVLGLLIIKDLVVTLLGIVSALISSLVIDRLFLSESKAFTAQIISENYDKINKKINEKLHRTTSILNIKGGYSGLDKKMLMVTFSLNQYNELINIIKTSDEKAFVTIQRAHEINGLGWK